MKSRLGIATALAVVTALFLTATASASEPLEDGDYTVTLPDGEAIAFTISDDGDTVSVGELPAGFTKDDASEDTTKISNADDSVTVEIRTGDDGKIEVQGLAFDDSDTVIAALPGTDGTVIVSLDGQVIGMPDGFVIEDTDLEGGEIEIRVSDGRRTFEIEIDLEDGSVEIKRQDDDSSSDDESDDADSDDESTDDESTDDTVLDDSRSDDDESDDDDDSSADVTESTVEQTTDTTPASPAVSDDDASSDDEDDESDDDSDDDDSSD